MKTAVDAFGTVDIVINNAGILRDISFQKMTDRDWDLIMLVHLKGAYSVSRAAWNIMREKNYGRIVNTASSSGIYGAFGQANYAAAKLGIHGFTQTLAKEGIKRNIRCNSIAPQAASRMTETVMPKEILEALDPNYVAPFTAYLCSEACQETGSLYEIAAGYITKNRWQQAKGVQFDVSTLSLEGIRDQWGAINQFDSGASIPTSAQDVMQRVLANMDNLKAAKAKGASAPAGGAAPSSGLKSEKIFNMMAVFLGRGEGKEQVAKVQAVFAFQITPKKGAKPELIYEINLKDGQGHCKQGKPAKADATFTMTDDDFEKVCLGTLNPQIAFMQGKMKIAGNMAKAQKFTPELFPAPTPEAFAKYAAAKL